MSLPALQAQVVAAYLRRVKLVLLSRHKSDERCAMEAAAAFEAARCDLPTGTLKENATFADLGLSSLACTKLSEGGICTVSAILAAGHGELERRFSRKFADRIRYSLATFGVHLTRDGARPEPKT